MAFTRIVRFLVRLLRAAASASLLTVLLAGLPVALIRFVGDPLPRHLPTAGQVRVWLGQPLTGGELEHLLAMLVWALWAAFAVALVVEARFAVRGVRAPRIRVLSPMQAVAAALVASLSLAPAGVAVTMSPPVPASAGPPAATLIHTGGPPAALAVTGTAVTTPPAPRSASTAPVQVTAYTVRVGERHYTCTVHRGDTLWDIAAVWLHDPLRWPEIYHLNQDHYDRHGRMRHGDHIEPGWVLVLPDDATPPSSTAPAAPPVPQPSPPQETTPSQQPTGPAAPATGTPDPAPTPASATPAAPAPASPDPAGAAPATPTPVPPSSAASSTPSHVPGRGAPPGGVSVPGGSWVDLGLAGAITAAAALVWIQRRRRYTPRPPSPALRLDDPDLAPMPPVVTQVRRALRRQAPSVAADEADPPPGVPADVPPTGQPAAQPVTPALQHPVLQIWPPAGLGLTGPASEAAARGFLAATLAAGGNDEPAARGQVVIPATTLATLLGADAVGIADTPRLSVTTGLPEALDVLEQHTLHRTRLVFDHEVEDVAALREADPLEEPLPPLLLIADAENPHERARIAALLTQGQRLDIHGVLLGVWADGNTVHVDPDGATTPAEDVVSRHGTHPADVGRLSVLDPVQTADLLRTLAEAHTGARQPDLPRQSVPAAPEPAPAPQPQTPNEKRTTDLRPVPPAPHKIPATDGPQPSTTPPTDNAPVKDDDQSTQPSGPTDAVPQPAPVDACADTGTAVAIEQTATTDAQASAPRAGPARVRVLGSTGIQDLPPPAPGDPPLRSKALEVLVYLIANGGQAPQHRVIADVLPDELHSQAHHRLNTYVSNLRVNLKRAAGPGTYVAPPAQQYALNRDTIEVDLWRMQAGIAAANGATDPAARIAALREAVSCYQGVLAAGRDYEWLEPYREAVRHQAIDAHLVLVDALGDEQPADAVQVLETAIGHDPYNEPLYQQAMHLHARLGDVEGIRALRRALTRRMSELDTGPGDDTLALADRLVTDLQRRPRGPTHLRGDAA